MGRYVSQYKELSKKAMKLLRAKEGIKLLRPKRGVKLLRSARDLKLLWSQKATVSSVTTLEVIPVMALWY
ncbi:unnamed protein product [Camellia sinensis]